MKDLTRATRHRPERILSPSQNNNQADQDEDDAGVNTNARQKHSDLFVKDLECRCIFHDDPDAARYNNDAQRIDATPIRTTFTTLRASTLTPLATSQPATTTTAPNAKSGATSPARMTDKISQKGVIKMTRMPAPIHTIPAVLVARGISTNWASW